MLTPRFEVSQDDKFLIITIYAPFTNLQDTEIFMDLKDFRFYSKPYYLRLHLPGEVEETDEASGNYDADIRSFVVNCPKKNAGEVFEGLDMLTKLLTPAGETCVKKNIEVIDENGEDGDEEEDEEEIDWYYEQVLSSEGDFNPLEKLSEKEKGYGFGSKQSGVYTNLLQEFEELLDIKDPDSKTHKQRLEERIQKEIEDFNCDHYLCDLFESDGVDECLSYEATTTNDVEFSKEDQEQLISLPKRKHVLDKEALTCVYMGLVDILYGQCYDIRTTGGDGSSESGWCVAKLSATLSCLARHRNIKEVLASAVRRSLIFPFYRSWDLGIAVAKDVAKLLLGGKISILKTLLQVHKAFQETEGYYIHNQLYLEDYLIWIQSVPDSHLSSLAAAVEVTVLEMTKDDLGLELDQLEQAAHLVMEEEEEKDVDTLTVCMDNVKIIKEKSDSDDSETDSDDSETDSDDSETDSDDSETDSNNVVNKL